MIHIEIFKEYEEEHEESRQSNGDLQLDKNEEEKEEEEQSFRKLVTNIYISKFQGIDES